MSKGRKDKSFDLYSRSFGEPRRKYVKGGAPKARRAIPIAVRFYVLRRDKHACQYCGAKAPDVSLHVDHIRPRSRGGSDHHTNLATACRDCNIGKGATPLDDDLERLIAGRVEAQSRIHIEGWLDGLPFGGEPKQLLAGLAPFADAVNGLEASVTREEAALLRGLQATGYVEPNAPNGASDIVEADGFGGLIGTVTLRTWHAGRLKDYGPAFPPAVHVHG